MIVVISLGGSFVNTENGINREFLGEVKKIILAYSDHKFGIVTGGGWKARQYANEVRKKGGSEFDADEAAIKATKENAKELIKTLGKSAYPKVAKDFTEAGNASKTKKYKIVVMGGTIPGITTDTDSVLLAEKLGAKRLVNISKVDAICDSDPNKNPNAKKFSVLGYDNLIALAVESDKRTAGTNFVFDVLACKLIARSRIETHFVSGNDIANIKNAIEGKPHGGTVVK